MMSKSILRQLFVKKSYQAYLLSISFSIASAGYIPVYAQPPIPPSTQAAPQTVPPAATTLPETEYTLGAGDQISINVFQVEELSGEYTVQVDGTVSLPLVGSVKVEGLTLGQLNNILSQSYAVYLKRPVVTASLRAARPLKVAISGEVNRPGSYTLRLGSVDSQNQNQGQQGQKFPSVSDLIQQAGGLTTTADVSQVQVRRNIQGRQQLYSLNMWELIQQGNQGQNITLRDGDVILIPTKDQIDQNEIRDLADANFGIQPGVELQVAVVGEVYRPGTYNVAASVTNRENNQGGLANIGSASQELPRLTKAIQQAGGIKPLANIRNVEIRRFTRGGKQQVIAVNLWELLQSGDTNKDILLQDGDTIVIPTAQALDPKESESLAAASFSPNVIRINVVGEVRAPGIVEVPPNTPLNQAILAAGGFDNQRAETDKVTLVRLNPDGTVSKRDVRIDLAQGVDEETNPVLRNNDVVVVNRSGLTATTDTIGTIVAPFGSIFGFLNFFDIFGN
jgi:polysaccharide biosynthesis/export protein